MRRIIRDPATDVREEVDFHLAALIEEYIAAGMTPEAARAAAQRRFGDIDRVTDTLNRIEHHRTRRMHLSERLGDIARDLRIATRQLLRTPVFTAVAIVTIALGIGANSAIFSVIQSVLLRPLPFEKADRIVVLRERNGAKDTQGMFVTVGNYATWAERSREFESLGAYHFGAFTLTGRGDPQRLSAIVATASLWKTLVLPPALGRYFTREEDHPGAAKVVVLSHGTWRSVFGADSSIVGRTITLNAEPYTVVGVAAPEYALTQRAAIWVPAAFTPEALADHGDHELTVVGLVRYGATIEGAIAELTRIQTALAKQYPDNAFDGGILWRSERDAIVGPVQDILLIVAGAVALTLLLASVNVANLLLGRAATREREMAVRAALGAGRGRLMAQLLVESLTLAVVGAAVGIGLGAVAIRTIVRTAPPIVPRLNEATMNGTVLAFAIALACACGIVFGLVPAVRASGRDLSESLRAGSRGLVRGGRDRTRGALVVAEVAISLVLLIGAGLCVRSAMRLSAVEPGFDPKNLLIGSVALPPAKYEGNEAILRTFDDILTRVRAIPGVGSATLISRMPIAMGGADCGVLPVGKDDLRENQVGANVRSVTPSYFSTMGTRIVRGRALTERDVANAAPVVVLTEGLARDLFGDADPIGQRVTKCVGGAPDGREVVGIAGDVRAYGLRNGTINEIYFPSTQVPQRSMWLAVRGSVPAASLTDPVRKAIAGVDANLPLASVSLMEDVIARSLATQRFLTSLLIALASIGAVIAAVGIYGVISYMVAQRTQEIGVRMALGARPGRLAAGVLGQGMALAVGGIVAGLAIAAASMRLLSSLLFEIGARDPLTFTAVALLILAIAAVACLVPAWRATRVDPLLSLRGD